MAFFSLDLVKEKLAFAYSLKDEDEMAVAIMDIVDICDARGNEHFSWFTNLAVNHFSGIIEHARYQILT
ncbi:hypothetical protein [Candidatus Weimeria sp. HCP3S3_B5]|uniref:hypothetical protein n=1 Tax=Candidatus Weimeria sp. HCP3S3_B5 TaxID=3438871 RepID=UPI003F8BB3AE